MLLAQSRAKLSRCGGVLGCDKSMIRRALLSRVIPRILTLLENWSKEPAKAKMFESDRVRRVMMKIIASDLSQLSARQL